MDLTRTDRGRIRRNYASWIKIYGTKSHHSLHWSSKLTQRKRFAVLLGVGIRRDDRVLDVGCGFGDFYSYVRRKLGSVQYCGIDIVPDMIKVFHTRFPYLQSRTGTIFELPKNEYFDYSVASGAFSFNIEQYKKKYFSIIQEMYRKSRKGIAFNVLDARVHPHNELFAAYDPDEVMGFCKRISNNVKRIDGYLSHDNTFYLHR